MNNFIFDGSLESLDPAVKQLISLEQNRQDETIILIASESETPTAVHQAVASSFGHIYAEGYPREASRKQTESAILDIDNELAIYRRNSDPRYYKGVEYADILEALTRRRAAELFAANGIKPENLFVNVQPLSGAPANSAIYTALLKPGDTILGLNLNDGGHLSHGTRINRSGKHYNGVAYFVDAKTEQLDYDEIERVAVETQPQIIIAGFSAYPFVVDWQRFRQIADKVGAYLMADIAHISGLVASGRHPSPIGIADVVSTTTHKSLCGPRGAMIMTHKKTLARKIDRAVFPGEQGGPHLNTMAGLAVALKLAQSETFKALQQRIVENAARLADKLQEHGLRIVGGGSENHLLLVDTKSVTSGGVHLSGDMAARILDVAGIVVNRNTIPGDKGALNPTGLRLGTVWISQLGFGPAEVDLLAEAIATVLQGCTPFTYLGGGGKKQLRAKVSFEALERGRALVRQLRQVEPVASDETAVSIRGKKAKLFLHHALTSDVASLQTGVAQNTHLFGAGLDFDGTLLQLAATEFELQCPDSETAAKTAVWLSDLSDGYVRFDDPHAKLAGPVVVKQTAVSNAQTATNRAINPTKPYFIGKDQVESDQAPLPSFSWEEPADPPLKTTHLHATHRDMGAKLVPFGGYDMPVWYSSVTEEHNAVRQTAGLFDVSHMGVFEASGEHVEEFLDLVTANQVFSLKVGRSHYSFLMLPNGHVIDDLFIYRLAPQKFLLVVNASNNDKDWAWLNAVNEGKVCIDEKRPFAKIQHPVTLRDLRDLQYGDECRVDLALQGPQSKNILMAMADEDTAQSISQLPWSGVLPAQLGEFDVIITRTGYTGERIAYELFVHPEKS
ncbi:MAG: serine hydroxymethyltransferase, partial [Chloroflexota bacterium]